MSHQKECSFKAITNHPTDNNIHLFLWANCDALWSSARTRLVKNTPRGTARSRAAPKRQ